MQQFLGFLPTTKQVICRVLNDVNFLKSKAVSSVAQELLCHRNVVQCLCDHHILCGQKSSRVG